MKQPTLRDEIDRILRKDLGELQGGRLYEYNSEATNQIIDLLLSKLPEKREPFISMYNDIPQHQKLEARNNTAFNQAIDEITKTIEGL